MRLQRSKKAQTLIIMLLLTSLCILSMGYTVYRIATNTLTQEIQNAYRMSLLQTQERVEAYFKQIDQSLLQFEKLPALDELLSLPEGSNNLEILSLLETMMSIQTSIDDVDDIALYRLDTRKLYSTNRQVTSFQQDYQAVISRFAKLNRNSAFFNAFIDDTPTTIYIRKLPIFQSTPPFYIVVHLNQQFFDHMLGSGQEIKGNYFILDEYDRLLQNRGDLDDETIARDVIPVVTERKSDSGGLFTAYLPPSQKGWTFGFAISNQELFRKIADIRNVIFLIGGIILTLAALATVLSTNRLWRGWNDIVTLLDDPVSVRHAKPTMPGIQDDEFREIYDKLQQIKETRDELKEQVKELTPEIKEAFIYNMLQKGLRSEEDLDKCQRYEIPLLFGGYSCLCVEIDQYKSMAEQYSDRDLFYFRSGVSKVIQEIIDSKGRGFVSYTGEGRFAAMLSLQDSGDGSPPGDRQARKETIREAAVEIRDFIERYFPYTVSIGVSLFRKDYAYLNLSAEEAENALKHKLVTGTNEVIPTDEFIPGDSVGSAAAPVSFKELADDLIYAIRSLDRESACRCADRIGTLQGLRTINYQRLQSQLTEMVFSIFRSVGGTLRRPPSEPLMSELLQLTTLEEWIGWLKSQAIEPLIGELAEEHREHMHQVADQLTEYIRRHNEENIRLDSCCKALNVPASVGRQALKEIHDSTFSDFLLQSRIEKAREWLLHTGMSVEEIASRLQYSNSQNFSRTFKKSVGLPPGQFRKESKAI
ncbi:HTH-type transcriptional regulator YesS [Paenibacillus konkukensis]|uniref:HTH-type transcriptional regulator YesS n=1 Tax=Paenibacillus konkukensis TaxID=2020716 RepID=A0ABY4RRI9_9BACL|nr:helix-turn-helix domain-containing protein [Paenibacillus konkukensis]UQZ85156.1 HTH-type transcriptional regulator YesS [Paenibacillus konkukensis]